MKHTKGPWKVGKKYSVRHREHIPIVPSELGGKAIAITWPLNLNATEEDEANAQLIASAPETAEERDKLKEINSEMLEALKLALPYMEVFMIRGEEPLVGENLKTDLFKVREAIAKAETI